MKQALAVALCLAFLSITVLIPALPVRQPVPLSEAEMGSMVGLDGCDFVEGVYRGFGAAAAVASLVPGAQPFAVKFGAIAGLMAFGHVMFC